VASLCVESCCFAAAFLMGSGSALLSSLVCFIIFSRFIGDLLISLLCTPANTAVGGGDSTPFCFISLRFRFVRSSGSILCCSLGLECCIIVPVACVASL